MSVLTTKGGLLGLLCLANFLLGAVCSYLWFVRDSRNEEAQIVVQSSVLRDTTPILVGEYVDNALWSSRIQSMSLTSNSLPLMYQGFPQQTFTCRRYANSFVSDSLILDYSAEVSGWAPSLDEIDFKVKSFTRVPHHSEPRLSPWSFTLGVGYSANCSTYRFEPSVSLTLGYNLFSLFPQKH